MDLSIPSQEGACSCLYIAEFLSNLNIVDMLSLMHNSTGKDEADSSVMCSKSV